MSAYKYILCTCIAFLTVQGIQSQNQEKAKKLFSEGNYAEAKPMFESLVKKNPRNGSLNYWYGVCCYETGEADKCLPYLEYAAERKVREAYRYIAMYHDNNYHFSDAEENWETYFELMEKAKKPTDEFQTAYDRASLGRQMMRSVQQITFIDSFVVDKTNFLATYRISQEAGSLDSYNSFFKENNQPEGIVYLTEMGNRIYFSASTNKESLRLYSADLIGDQWGSAMPLNGITAQGNISFPYMLSDGCTFYYAAEGEESLGGYDIFVTRYDAEKDQYLVPENIGMPFNSPFNDYMYVIDEYNNLGWFASDRYQPEDKICIYVFLPEEDVLTFNEEKTGIDTLSRRARISSIADTQTNGDKVRMGKQRLANITYIRPQKEEKKDFEFIIDDLTTYYLLTDFNSSQARQLFNQRQQEIKNLIALSLKLEQRRDSYAKSTPQQRSGMTAEILDLEKRVEEMEANISRLEVEIRNTEIGSMKP